jgi:hypothetical protein
MIIGNQDVFIHQQSLIICDDFSMQKTITNRQSPIANCHHCLMWKDRVNKYSAILPFYRVKLMNKKNNGTKEQVVQQTRREISRGEVIWGPTDGPTNRRTN